MHEGIMQGGGEVALSWDWVIYPGILQIEFCGWGEESIVVRPCVHIVWLAFDCQDAMFSVPSHTWRLNSVSVCLKCRTLKNIPLVRSPCVPDQYMGGGHMARRCETNNASVDDKTNNGDAAQL